MANTNTYVGVWLMLVVATIMEVTVRYLLPGFSLVSVVYAVAIISIVKGVLIALYFQHLRYEKKTIGALPIVAVLVLCTLLITAILSVGMGM